MSLEDSIDSYVVPTDDGSYLISQFFTSKMMEPIIIKNTIISNFTVEDLHSMMLVCKKFMHYICDTPMFWRLISTNIEKRLSWAVTKEHLSVIKGLMQRDENVLEIPNKEGNTLLWRLAKMGDDKSVQLLLSIGAKSENPKGQTSPVWIAASYGNAKVVKLLLKSNADPKFKTIEGTTPLWRACQLGQLACVKVLLKFEPSLINEYSSWGTLPGCSPLWIAAREGHLSIVKYLIEKGADLKAMSIDGLDPLQAAIRVCLELSKDFSGSKTSMTQLSNCREVIDYLIQYGIEQEDS